MDHQHHQIRRPQRSCSSSSVGGRNYSRFEFFKVFVPNFSSNELLIPPDFVRQLKSRSRTIPSNAILKDHNGQEWNVELTKKAHRLFIEKGWPDFVNGWSLVFGDFLIFRYYRKKLIFSVKVFARNGCLKEQDVLLSSETSEDRPPTPDIDKNIPVVVEVKSDDEEEENVTRGGEIRRRLPVRVCKKKYLSLNLENLKMSRTSSFNKQITTLPQPLVIETAPAPEPVKCVLPKHPHFVAVMTRITTKNLFLPSLFLKRNNIQLKPQVILHDEKGSQWPIKIETLYEAQRITMTDGWSEFWRSNNVKVGDNFVFEFVLEDENRCEEIHVQICEAGLKTQRCNRYLVVVP